MKNMKLKHFGIAKFWRAHLQFIFTQTKLPTTCLCYGSSKDSHNLSDLIMCSFETLNESDWTQTHTRFKNLFFFLF